MIIKEKEIERNCNPEHKAGVTSPPSTWTPSTALADRLPAESWHSLLPIFLYAASHSAHVDIECFSTSFMWTNEAVSTMIAIPVLFSSQYSKFLASSKSELWLAAKLELSEESGTGNKYKYKNRERDQDQNQKCNSSMTSASAVVCSGEANAGARYKVPHHRLRTFGKSNLQCKRRRAVTPTDALRILDGQFFRGLEFSINNGGPNYGQLKSILAGQ
ncbi:hypothetical protein EVAR_29759_1 [Eumeta japonica]|uniref:Uncharacterized protein n=1 Tax=Eumeta variegata TaxID=151549 RepID=A0A4C1WXS8_EUMVA|nr:hypothetical protein EVAR_29759_1 [Eumeta japonica]